MITFIEFLNKLKNNKLIHVGILCKNKRKMPTYLYNILGKNTGNFNIYYSNNKTLISYVPK